jgi:hypothetical protein
MEEIWTRQLLKCSLLGDLNPWFETNSNASGIEWFQTHALVLLLRDGRMRLLRVGQIDERTRDFFSGFLGDRNCPITKLCFEKWGENEIRMLSEALRTGGLPFLRSLLIGLPSVFENKSGLTTLDFDALARCANLRHLKISDGGWRGERLNDEIGEHFLTSLVNNRSQVKTLLLPCWYANSTRFAVRGTWNLLFNLPSLRRAWINFSTESEEWFIEGTDFPPLPPNRRELTFEFQTNVLSPPEPSVDIVTLRFNSPVFDRHLKMPSTFARGLAKSSSARFLQLEESDLAEIGEELGSFLSLRCPLLQNLDLQPASRQTYRWCFLACATLAEQGKKVTASIFLVPKHSLLLPASYLDQKCVLQTTILSLRASTDQEVDYLVDFLRNTPKCYASQELVLTLTRGCRSNVSIGQELARCEWLEHLVLDFRWSDTIDLLASIRKNSHLKFLSLLGLQSDLVHGWLDAGVVQKAPVQRLEIEMGDLPELRVLQCQGLPHQENHRLFGCLARLCVIKDGDPCYPVLIREDRWAIWNLERLEFVPADRLVDICLREMPTKCADQLPDDLRERLVSPSFAVPPRARGMVQRKPVA